MAYLSYVLTSLSSIFKLELQLQATLDAVASPRRRAILRLVWDRELAAGDIAAQFADISWPAVSQNLRVLCDAGLISQRKAGHFRLYQANHAAVGPLEPFLRAMWAADLDQLRDIVERDQRERPR
jgi:DNA-binding transcriptional ArsR family regulator